MSLHGLLWSEIYLHTILNMQPPCYSSQYKYIGCSVAFEILQRKAVTLSERFVDSNRSMRSHNPGDCKYFSFVVATPNIG